MRLCLGVYRSKAGTLSVHLVIQVSADVGIQGRMLSSITNSLREKKYIYIVSPEECYQSHNHLHVIFTQEKIYDFKTIHPR